MREYILTQAQSREQTHVFPALRRVIKNWLKRRSLRKLEDLDDYMLTDIGLTRADLVYAQKLPLDIDPIIEIGHHDKLETHSHGRRHP